MPSQLYTWKRFWCPRSGNIGLSDGGYLVNPDSEWGHFYKSDSVAFETISEIPCLVLLGEAGMGKTTATEQAYHQVSHKFSGSENVCLWFRLGDYDSDKQLCDAIFRDETLQAWRRGTNKLHLFLDSLDEGLLSIKILVRILKREIEQLPCDRLYFRITCRTADWKDSLEQKLKDKWGEANVAVYELAPLCQVDVIEAANRCNINSGDFLQEVFNKNAIPLAIKPITLKLLLGTYQNKRFSSSQKDLYEEGCLQLCEEVNSDRCDSGFTGNLDAKHRLVIASRIAALLLFSNRSAIWISPEYGDMPNSDIAIRDISIGKESINQQEFSLDENCIKEVLSVTELFSSRGSHRIGFAHQTYAEFLAARYLVHNETPLEQVMKLIASSEDSEFRLIPQLHETAAWLASILPKVFREVMKTDPDVLLLSDVATAGETDKTALVESLLRLHNEEKLTYQYHTWLYRNLNHPKLADQLQPYICDSTKSINAKNVAIDIAEACNVKAVQEYLADVALDHQQHSSVRINAAVAVCNLGDEKTKARLKPLAVAKIQNYEEEQLKGCGIRAVWPGNITAEEVFSTLIQPVSKSSGGRYQDFIAKELGQHLQISDLPVALRWLEKQFNSRGRDLHYSFEHLSDAIMLKAWEHLNQPEVMQAFAKVALLRLKNHDVIVYDDSYQTINFSHILRNEFQTRYQIIESIISIVLQTNHDYIDFANYIREIIYEEDFSWLIQKFKISDTEDKQRSWAKLILWNFKLSQFEHVDPILQLSQTNSVLREEFAYYVETVELDSLIAQEEKEIYLAEQARRNRNKNKIILEPSAKERVLDVLSQIDASQPNIWCSLCCELTLKVDSTHYGNPFESSLKNLPGWIEAEESTKKRIIQAANLYLAHANPDNLDLLGTNNYPYSVLAGYQALLLLIQEASEYILSLSTKEWQKWTPVILAHPNWDRTEDNKKHRQELIKKAYHNAPDEFIKTLIFLIDKDNEQHGSIHINNQVSHCWDERLLRVLMDKVKHETLTATSMGDLLRDLLINKVNQAQDFAEYLVSSLPPKSAEERAKAIVAAQMLILYAEDAGWSVVWSAIQKDSEFGREVMQSVSYSIKYQGSTEQKLKEDCIADLYIFLTKQYPDPQEKQKESSQKEELTGIEAYEVRPEDSVRTWRDYIPQRLQERGTPQACEALRKIILEFPELKDKLQWRLLEAEALIRRQTWQPLKPEQILQIVSNKPKNQSTYINQTGVFITMPDSNNPNLNFSGSVGAVNLNSTVNGDQIGTQHNYAQEQNLIEAFEEIQQIVNRITQNYPTQTEAEKQIIIAEAVEQVKQNPTLRKRLEVGGKAFIFEAFQKASDQWWVAPIVKAIEAVVKGE
ncbi:MAG: hypothetical protein V7K53_22570 [Nostoc sp.]|uniref:NACHT domain-containing protein n=1 Tax=Nostoc sp. TaxID=1180 RepID=UPI002FF75CB9